MNLHARDSLVTSYEHLVGSVELPDPDDRHVVAAFLRDRMRQRRLQATGLLLRTLPYVECPVAGIRGAEDALYRGRPDVVAHALRQAPAFKSLVFIPDAGHWVQYEDASAFDAALTQALR